MMALVGWKLSKYNIGIAAPSKTCFAGEGQLTELYQSNGLVVSMIALQLGGT